MNEYLSLTDLGKLYGGSSHVVGKWLKGLGLRTESGQPTVQAFNEKYVAQRTSRQPGTFFYVWHAGRTTELLDGMQYPRADHDRSNGSIGQELVDADGRIIAWTTDSWVAQVICKLMNESSGS